MLLELVSNSGGYTAVIKCDHCGKQRNKPYKLVKGRVLHFCNRACSNAAKKPGGVMHAHVSSAWAKGRKTLYERYDVTNPMQIPGVAEKISNHGRSKTTVQRTKDTLMARYGVSCSYLIPEIQKRAQSDEACQKRVASQLKTFQRTSKAERMFIAALRIRLGDDAVRTDVILNSRWSIDVYVAPFNLHVQVDGVYWHGLDRPIEDIAEHKTKRDAKIHYKWTIDRKQEEWAREHDVKLVRVTDRDILQDVEAVVSKILTEYHDGNTCSNRMEFIFEL